MNATARNIPGEVLAETVVYQPAPAADLPESPAMPRTAPTPHRYSLASGARPLDGYTIKRAIGRGGFGEVYYATSDAGKEVALKLVTRNCEVERRGVVQCMNLKSPNLVAVHDLKTNDEGDSFVIMEYVAGPSLANVLAQHPEGLPPQEVRAWLKGLIDGVAYLHDHGIVHRDLKPANLFLEDGFVKIGDYGLSKLIAQSQGPGNSESIGTCHYMAPEISTGKYHKPIDIYALGVILFEMLTGHVPFDGESAQEILMKHLTARPDTSRLPSEYREIVEKALSKDPNHRQASPFGLLPVADLPRPSAVRYIGDGQDGTPTDGIVFEAERPKDDILYIEAEPSSVFHIGPNTWPTRRRDVDRKPPKRPARPSPRPTAVARPAPRPVAPPPPPRPRPAPLGPPPPLPSVRVRVAELATSMVLAAPLLALLCLPTVVFLNAWFRVGMTTAQVAMVFGLALVGTWAILFVTKYWEGGAVSWPLRRLIGLGSGFLMGPLALALLVLLEPGMGRWIGPDGPNFFIYGACFALAFATVSAWNVSGRDRGRRFRLLPVLATGLIVLLPAMLLPAPGTIGMPALTFWPMPQCVAVALLVAITSQVVSPWSHPAAAHARESRRRAA